MSRIVNERYARLVSYSVFFIDVFNAKQRRKLNFCTHTGDKQMLINKIRSSYRDLIRYLDPVQATITLDNTQPAANASSFEQPEMQARRLRRQRRSARAGQQHNNSWSVRTW